MTKYESVNEQHFQFEIIDAVSDDKTLKVKSGDNEFFMHSIVDPRAQGEDFAKLNYSDKNDIFLYGLGLGYHVIALYNMLLPEQKIYLLECNEEIIPYALQSEELKYILKDRRIIFLGTSEDNEVRSFYRDLPRNIKKLYYYPSVKTIPIHLDFLREALVDLRMDSNVSMDQMLMEKNHNINADMYPDFLRNYNGQWNQLPCVIAVSGPSLKEAEFKFEEFKEKALFISAGRNISYFSGIDFNPDIYIEVDPGDIPVSRFMNIQSDSLLLFASTVKPELPKGYFGPKAQIIMDNKLDQTREYGIKGGGSTVASTALELAIELGCNPIILIGQDLCYIEGNSHFDHQETARISSPEVSCNDGKKRKTNEAFLKHKRSIEKVIDEYGKKTKVYSVSSKSSTIDGVEFVDIDKILNIKNDQKIDRGKIYSYINLFR